MTAATRKRKRKLKPTLRGRRARRRTFDKLQDVPHDQLMVPAVPRAFDSRADWDKARQNIAAFQIWDGERIREDYQPLVMPGMPSWLPRHLVYLADVSQLAYLSDKYDSVPREWIHTFGEDSEPVLALDPQSGVLLILGWGERYDVTAAGIVDADQRRPDVPSLVKRRWPGE